MCVLGASLGAWGGGPWRLVAAGRGRGQLGAHAYLPILLQVVMQNLGVRLLMGCQDVHEGGWGVRGGSGGVDGAAAAQGRRQVEGGRRGAGVESLLLKGLLREGEREDQV